MATVRCCLGMKDMISQLVDVICRPETFEMLAYTLTVQKLVDVFGYPKVGS